MAVAHTYLSPLSLSNLIGDPAMGNISSKVMWREERRETRFSGTVRRGTARMHSCRLLTRGGLLAKHPSPLILLGLLALLSREGGGFG